MDKITLLILSDSHGRGALARKALAALEKCGDTCSRVIFLGDGLSDISEAVGEGRILEAVRGNCDRFGDFYDELGNEIPTKRMIQVGELRVLITHGHEYSVKGGLGWLIGEAGRLSADVVLFGHTHLPLSLYVPPDDIRPRPLWLFNPGSLADGSFGTMTVSGKDPLFGHGKV